jgi:hypothetical protein
MNWFHENSDKLIVLAILAAFGYSAAHGAQYSQHVVDWTLGALGVLIVQRAAKALNPNSPNS